MKPLMFNLFLAGFLFGLLFSLLLSTSIDERFECIESKVNKLNKACATVESEPLYFDSNEVQCKNGVTLNYYKLEQDND